MRVRQSLPAKRTARSRSAPAWSLALVVMTVAAHGQTSQSGNPLPANPQPAAVQSASLEEAQREMKTGAFGKAESAARLYLQREPSSADARYLLAYALMRQDKAKEALEEYTRAAALRTPSALDLVHVAQAYNLLGDDSDAEKWLLASLRMDSGNADGWYNLGRLRYTQNRFAEAVQCYGKALALAPQSVKAENNLGLALEGLNRPEDAERAYRRALAWQDADHADAPSEQPLLNLAILLLHRNADTEAQGLLLRAVAIAPKDPRIHEQLGQLYLRESRFADAEREFKTATELAPGRSSLHFLLGQAYRHLGQQREASAEFAEAARLARISPENGSK